MECDEGFEARLKVLKAHASSGEGRVGDFLSEKSASCEIWRVSSLSSHFLLFGAETIFLEQYVGCPDFKQFGLEWSSHRRFGFDRSEDSEVGPDLVQTKFGSAVVHESMHRDP